MKPASIGDVSFYFRLFRFCFVFHVGEDWTRMNPATVASLSFGPLRGQGEFLPYGAELYLGWVPAWSPHRIDPWSVQNSYRALNDRPFTIDSASWTGRYRDDVAFGRLYPHRELTLRWAGRVFHKVIEGKTC